MLVCDELVDELTEKLVERGISQERVVEFLTLLGRLAEWVDVPNEAVKPVIEADPDDLDTLWEMGRRVQTALRRLETALSRAE